MANTNKNTKAKPKTKTPAKKTPAKKTTGKAVKKPTGKNVDFYEIKLLLLVSVTILSALSLHTELVGFIGRIIRNLYFGLFSHAGYFLPYIILVAVFYKINNRLILHRTKTIISLILIFISIIMVVNIFGSDYLNANYLNTDTSVLKITSLIDSFNDGVYLEGSGLIGNLLGAIFIKLFNITGLYIVVGTMWLIAFVLITNIKLSDVVSSFISKSKNNIKENAQIKKKTKEEYIKESTRLEEVRNSEIERLKKEQSKNQDKFEQELSEEKLRKAREKIEKKLKAEEKEIKKEIQDFDVMFTQSPTKSILDKILKKSTIPTVDELKNQKLLDDKKKNEDFEKEEAFSMFDSSGYSFDNKFEENQIEANAPEIFDNHLNSEITEEEITGFGTLIEDSIKKAYDDSDAEFDFTEEIILREPETFGTEEEIKDKEVTEIPFEEYKAEKSVKSISSFDAANKIAENVKTGDEIFENGDPMSPEEKQNALSFDALINNKSTNAPSPSSGISTSITPSAISTTQVHESNTSETKSIMSETVMNEFENYKIPGVSILKKNSSLNKENKSAALEKARQLEEILDNFNIDAKVIQISKGPAITRYEIQLKPGTKMSKIVGLSDDIALNLATQQVRIAAVPGKAAVGIEVPNDSTSLVTLREVIETDEFKSQDAKLSVGLGKNISGSPIVADLGKMPHMLIAGATGSGKSVCVNTLITSILLNSKPDEVKFLMIDPKVVELNNYNGIPHLILPVVTDPKKASIALNWAVQEMTRRYNEFAEKGCRDIKGFNKKYGNDKSKFMPQIVVIIDELADLMMVAPNQVEDAICRLAQMARAAGIHLIVATQRPSVDVITGVIKANIPSRIAFAVSSSIDSRTIIDMSGAEKLLGKGDMLYYPVGSSKPERVQGAFISDEEVEAVVDAVKNQFKEFSYDDSILDEVSKTVETTNESDDDEYLSKAISLVVEMEQASISMLQRKFKIGYNRAARLVDEMEERGVVGPPMGSKPRMVLISKSDI